MPEIPRHGMGKGDVSCFHYIVHVFPNSLPTEIQRDLKGILFRCRMYTNKKQDMNVREKGKVSFMNNRKRKLTGKVMRLLEDNRELLFFSPSLAMTSSDGSASVCISSGPCVFVSIPAVSEGLVDMDDCEIAAALGKGWVLQDREEDEEPLLSLGAAGVLFRIRLPRFADIYFVDQMENIG